MNLAELAAWNIQRFNQNRDNINKELSEKQLDTLQQNKKKQLSFRTTSPATTSTTTTSFARTSFTALSTRSSLQQSADSFQRNLCLSAGLQKAAWPAATLTDNLSFTTQKLSEQDLSDRSFDQNRFFQKNFGHRISEQTALAKSFPGSATASE